MGNKILAALVCGLLIGFSTHYTSPFIGMIGDGFIMLLQMTALPYISVSLIFGIGSMSRRQAKTLALYGSITFLLIVLSALILIALTPLAFPNWQSAAFYNPSAMMDEPEKNVLTMFIPANPFYSYAQSIVPAVVLFSVFIGIGFIGVENKRRTLYVFKDLRHALSLVTNSVMKLAPIGVFAIALHASAQLTSETLNGMTVYIVTAACLVLLICFVLLPLIVAMLTPLTYLQVVNTAKEAMITAFATGSLFVVLPLIVENVRNQLGDYAKMYNDARRIPSIIVPISYSLPIGGKLLAILFVLFAAWFSGEDVPIADYPQLMVLAVLQLFGSVMVAVPNLLDTFEISKGMFDLFVISEQIIVGRLSAMLSVMYITTMSLLVTLMLIGKLRFHPKSFVSFVLAVPIATAGILYALSSGFNSITHQYQGYDKFIDRSLLLPPAEATYLNEPNLEEFIAYEKRDTLKAIERRGFIRMGYYRDSLPFAFHNKKGELVGLDVEIIHLLAQELGVGVEFVKIYRNQTAELLANGYLDIISGIPVTPDNLVKFTLSTAYIEEPLALLVRDEERKQFSRWRNVLDNKDLVIGIPEAFFNTQTIRKNLPDNKVWELATPRLMFKEQGKDIDAMIYGAAASSAWTLLYPEFAVVIPKPHLPPIAYGFGITTGDEDFRVFLGHWISMKKRSKTIEGFYKFWIEGKHPGYFVK